MLNSDEKHIHRGAEEVREEGTRRVGNEEPCRKSVGICESEEVDLASYKTEIENVRL